MLCADRAHASLLCRSSLCQYDIDGPLKEVCQGSCLHVSHTPCSQAELQAIPLGRVDCLHWGDKAVEPASCPAGNGDVVLGKHVRC